MEFQPNLVFFNWNSFPPHAFHSSALGLNGLFAEIVPDNTIRSSLQPLPGMEKALLCKLHKRAFEKSFYSDIYLFIPQLILVNFSSDLD